MVSCLKYHAEISWHLSENFVVAGDGAKVRRFLKMLEDDGMIAQKSDTKKTLITLVNYGFYQDSEKEKTTQKHHRNDTETTQKHTYKKEKKDKKEKNNNIHNFQQREYDFEDLEQRLLEKQFKPE